MVSGTVRNEIIQIGDSVMKNLFEVRPTRVEHRKGIKNDYIIVMNENVRKERRIRKYAVVQKLFQNSMMNDREWRTMIVFGRVVIDNSLGDNEIAMDQTLRNALGMENNTISGMNVKLYSLERTFSQKLKAAFRPGQFLCLRVNYPALNDMEKNICRISPNSMKLLNSKDGNHIWIECCESDYRRDMKNLLNEIINEKNVDRYKEKEGLIEKYFRGISLVDELYIDLPGIRRGEKKDTDYIRSLAEVMLEKENEKKSENEEENEKVTAFIEEGKRVLNNIVAYGEWMYEAEYSYRLSDITLQAYEYDIHSENHIRNHQQKDATACLSMNNLYPDSDQIFNMEPDLETIRLDKYYRDLLSLSILDSVKVKRRWIESLRDDIIEYGLVFVLTIFAAVAAVTPENHSILRIAVPIAVVFTLLIMLVRNK